MCPRLETLRWEGESDGHLVLIDQTELPLRFQEHSCSDVESVWEAIRSLRVRGAPAIGIAAAYGVVLGLRESRAKDEAAFFRRLDEVVRVLGSSRPTAVNLFWALRRLSLRAEHLRGAAAPAEIHTALWHEARMIHDEDRAVCRAIGRHGATLLEDGMGVLTHCNAGWLATAEYGTALAAIYAAHEQGKRLHVYADETRPLLQGARLTAWELMQHGVEVTLICDSMAAQVMRENRVQVAITGADRIAANGDTANKIGTYGVAVLAQAHGIPFYVAAPCSTFDLATGQGSEIPIEQRDAREITRGMGRQTAPDGVRVYNPAFDVTPARLIKAIVTERGLISPVSTSTIAPIIAAAAMSPDGPVP
ncbi:MAG: S-methyl-5-thioribose-1-phosphate isomerase [Planctomycetes bacterium]|nr:S-methyl-5-thioribose-1-phosphate isomerase [Planctomycetota bacterium]